MPSPDGYLRERLVEEIKKFTWYQHGLLPVYEKLMYREFDWVYDLADELIAATKEHEREYGCVTYDVRS